MFGKVREVRQRETVPFWPRSPYGVAKVFSYWAAINYRESYGVPASNGILSNPRKPAGVPKCL
jgi:GDPmannose 4,6-dehydratase